MRCSMQSVNSRRQSGGRNENNRTTVCLLYCRSRLSVLCNWFRYRYILRRLSTWERQMGVRRYLDAAVGELISARRRAELKRRSRELIYNIEVLIRAVSRVKDQVSEENHAKQKEQKEEEAKAFARARKAYARTERPKTAKKTK